MFILSLLSSLKGVLIQEKRLFDIMVHEVGTFLGEAAEVLQIQMEKWFFFLNPGDGPNCNFHQSNALLTVVKSSRLPV